MRSSVLLISALSVYALPSSSSRKDPKSTIYIPPVIKDTSMKVIPDAHHPFMAPGNHDLRGPCPGLNTLANHGYLPRHGIVSMEDLVNAVQEGFNMEHDIAAGFSAFGMLARGNVLLNKLSIGGPTPMIPPLPGAIDGTPGGLATHGRFEGDMSMTRYDFGLGDNVNFQQPLFDNLLTFVNKHTTNQTVTDVALAEFKVGRWNDSQAKNPNFDLTDPRYATSLQELGFTLGLFANASQGVLTVPVMTSFFAHQQFPQNWHRQGKQFTEDDVVAAFNPHSDHLIAAGIGMIVPGKKINGTYTLDPTSGIKCSFYNKIAAKAPAAIFSSKADPQTRANANALFNLISSSIGGGCPVATPSGPLA